MAVVSHARSCGKLEGAGLGLALSHKFVQFMGGTLSVESHVGQGTTFTVTIQGEPADSCEYEQLPPIHSQTFRTEQAPARKTLNSADLDALSVDILHDLEQAAMQGDMEEIDRVIESIRSFHTGLGDALTELANEFEYGKIVTLIREYRSASHESP